MDDKIDILLIEYRECLVITENTNYNDKSSVKEHNNAVDRMRVIITDINKMGQSSIKYFAELLDDPTASKWLAHQLVDIDTISEELHTKCISVIRKLAEEDSVSGYGEKLWLESRGYKI